MRRITTASIILLLVLAAVPAVLAGGLTPYGVAKVRSVGSASVSPDGSRVAYTVRVPRRPFEDENGPSWTELHLLTTDGERLPFVTGEVNVSSVDWTPDGKSISFVTRRDGDDERSLYVISAAGGEARRVLTHDSGIDDYSWSPDGKRVAFISTEKEPKEVKELQEKGFNQEVYEENLRFAKVWIAHPGEGDGEARELDLPGSASEVLWSPDGEHLAVVLAPTSLVDDALMARKVRVVNVETGKVVTEINNPGKLGDVAWSPDGKHLAMVIGEDIHDPSPGRLVVVPASGGELKDLIPGYLGHVGSVAWKDADTLYFIGEQGVGSTLEEIRRDGSARKILLASGASGGEIWESFSASHSGTRVALTADSPKHPTELFTFDVAAGPAERRTDSNPWLADVELAPQEVVRYKARDGLEIEGLLIRPLHEKPGERYPLVTVVHGGPESHYSNGWLTNYASPGQTGAADGYFVFYPNYRASTGRGVEFSKLDHGDPAGKEFDDVVDGVDYLIGKGWVDKDRVGVTGGSYGGYATAWLSTYYSERFAAGVMFVGISEKIAKFGTSDIPQELYQVHDRFWPFDDWEHALKASPIYYVKKAKTPLLILHGKDDPRVHPSQSLMLYRYLKILGQTPVRLIWYPGEGHGNRNAASRLDYSLRQLRWLGHYLKGPGGDPPDPNLDYQQPDDTAEETPPEVTGQQPKGK